MKCMFVTLFKLSAILLISLPLTSRADPRLIIHLSDYLANDYSGAVNEEGKILSEVEYAEQVEFSKVVAAEFSTDLILKKDATLAKDIEALEKEIKSKSGPSIVAPLARKVQKAVIRLSGVDLSPQNWPNYKRAKELFRDNCSSCHGENGRGDGPAGKDLDPQPSNFHDLTRAPTISPFAAFNTIRLGVPGTAMPAFELSDDDVWVLAFYVNTFRFSENKNEVKTDSAFFTEDLLIKAASLNDRELNSYLTRINSKFSLSSIRLHGTVLNENKYITKALELLELSAEAFKNQNLKEAKRLSLAAYFEGIEPIETKISANDPNKVTVLEEKMSNFRSAINHLNGEKLSASHRDLKILLNELGKDISTQKITSGIAFTSGFSIFVREGFEAALIIMALLAVGKASTSTLVSMSIHLGWIFSIVLGFIGWLISGWLLSIGGYSRELVEGLTSLFAVFILIYVGFWMHRQTEVKRWNEFINVRVKNLVQTRNLFGLFALSFIVSFREVFETVIFLRTIYAEANETARTSLFWGVLSGGVVVLVVGILVSKYRKRVPLQHFFNLSALLMLLLSVVLTGKGIHALQEAGLVNVSIVEFFPRIEIMGFYPSLQVLLAQFSVGSLCFVIWRRGRRRHAS